MNIETFTLGSLAIHKGPENNFEDYTTSRVKSLGKLTEFFVEGEGVRVLVGYAKFINGDRDVRTVKVYREFEKFHRLTHGLRLTLQPIPEDARVLYAELRQAFPKDGFATHQTLHPTVSEVDLDQGAGLSVFDELKKAGAQAGSRRELFGDTGKRAAYLCIRFPKDNLWAPIVAYIVTRILPIKLGYRG